MPRSLAYKPENSLNAICPYFTMFPLEYPLKVLKKYRKSNTVVLDPFCGRGTTLFAARALGLHSIGVDVSPVAVAIAKAKLAYAESHVVLNLAEELISKFIPVDLPDSRFFEMAYHPKVLKDICSLRSGLLALGNGRETDASVILRALVLGCLHGPLSQDNENASYLSNQMPRTFGPKPNYSLKYWQDTDFRAPELNVIDVIRRKLNRIFFPMLVSGYENVILGDSQLTKAIPSALRNHSLVVTSPPYFGMHSYIQDQWLRNWFLGGPTDVDYSRGPQLKHSSIDDFVVSLGKVWKNLAETESTTLDLFVRFGSIPSAAVDSREMIKSSLDESGVGWRIVSIKKASTAEAGKRQAKQMKSESKAKTEYDFHITKIH